MILMVISGVGFFVCLYIMWRTNHGVPGLLKYDKEFKLLDMRFRYNSNTVYDTFEKIGNEGVIAYRNFLMLDFVFITFFLLFMISISIRVTDNNLMRNVLIISASSR